MPTGDKIEGAPVASTSAQNVSQNIIQNYNIDQPGKFNFQADEWPKWSRRFERYRIASGLKCKNESEQVNMLIYIMGEKADDIFLSFKLTDVQENQYSVVIDRFNKHFIPQKNEIFERAKFNSRTQQTGETVKEYLTTLYELSENCNYEKYQGLRDELIRDRLVVGLLNKKVT